MGSRNPISYSGGVSGEEGLVLAIIATAVNDVLAGDEDSRQDAFRYFASAVYEDHVAFLGMPLRLPAALYKGE